MTITTVYGFRALNRLSVVAVPLLFLFLIYVVIQSLNLSDWEKLNLGNGELSFLSIISLSAGAFMSLAVTMPDLCRYTRDYKQAIIASVLSLMVGYPLVLILASIPGLAANSHDFIVIIFAMNLGFSALLILILSTWTTNASNLYSATLVFSSILTGLSYRKIAMLIGFLGTTVGLFGIIEQFIPFLFLLGIVVSPIAGIYSVDYFLTKNKQARYEIANLESVASVNWLAILSWLVESIIAGMAQANIIKLTGMPTCDAIFVAAGLYFLASKYKVDSFVKQT